MGCIEEEKKGDTSEERKGEKKREIRGICGKEKKEGREGIIKKRIREGGM